LTEYQKLDTDLSIRISVGVIDLCSDLGGSIEELCRPCGLERFVPWVIGTDNDIKAMYKRTVLIQDYP